MARTVVTLVTGLPRAARPRVGCGSTAIGLRRRCGVRGRQISLANLERVLLRAVDFDDSPEQAAFRREAREWLEAHAPRRTEGDSGMSYLAGAIDEDVYLRQAREWQALLYDEGWAGITWPKEYGGRGGTAMQALIFSQELRHFDPPDGAFVVGVAMAGPTLLAFGSAEQKQRYLRPMLRGEEIWCQLFSEPGAGSDLASLTTRAVRDGEEWVVNGQKVWTSGAHFSDFAILLARTDPDAAKHRGISYFLLDMRSPGIEVRPLRQANGASHFNEVFLTDVRIPASGLVGEAGRGWSVAMSTLGAERAVIGEGGAGPTVGQLVKWAKERDWTRGAGRDRVANAVILARLLEFLGYRAQTKLARGQDLSTDASVMKLAFCHYLSVAAPLGIDVAGPRGMLSDQYAGEALRWQQYFLTQWSSRIGGGTEQIQRNIIAERILGLPPEPRPGA